MIYTSSGNSEIAALTYGIHLVSMKSLRKNISQVLILVSSLALQLRKEICWTQMRYTRVLAL
jgi:hypothetical protein